MGEAAEPDIGTRLTRLMRFLITSVGPFDTRASVPRGDLVSPLGDRSTELADLGWAGLVLEINTEPLDELDGEVGIVDVVDAAHGFLACYAVRTIRRSVEHSRGTLGLDDVSHDLS